jgi:hypothetical protein
VLDPAIIQNIERMDEAGLATVATGRVVLCGSGLRKAFERAIGDGSEREEPC